MQKMTREPVLLFLSFLLISFNTVGQTLNNAIKDTGSVGIGTLAPAERLEIRSANPSNIQLTHMGDAMGSVGAIRFNMAGTPVGQIELERTVAANRLSALKFSVNTGSLMEIMRLHHNGFVGIGTNAPMAKLHVNAPPASNIARFTYNNVQATDAFLSISNGTGATDQYIPIITGRSQAPGRVFGLYLTAEANDVVPIPAETSFAALILDARNKTGAKLLHNNVLAINNYGINLMMVKADGSVGIGTINTHGHKLAVNGSGIFTQVKVKSYSSWPDFVFEHDYQLPSLYEVERFIKTHQHLPDIPTASEIAEEGQDLGEMNRKLLQKIEELTLYVIALKKEVDDLKASQVMIQK